MSGVAAKQGGSMNSRMKPSIVRSLVREALLLVVVVFGVILGALISAGLSYTPESESSQNLSAQHFQTPDTAQGSAGRFESIAQWQR